MYKRSPFIIEYENIKGEYLVYNVLNNDFIKADESQKELLKRVLSGNKFDTKTEKLQHYLINNKYLFEESVSNLQLAQLIFHSRAWSHQCLHLIIMPTEQCNFRCIYCYETYKKGAMNELTQISLISAVKKLMKEYKQLYVEWFGGEPLLEPEIIERLSYEFKKICADQKKPYYAGMTTNGYLLNYEMYQRMKKCNILEYQITLDGLKEYHDKTRVLFNGEPTYEKIINNLLEIKSRDRSPVLKIMIRTNYTQESNAKKGEWETILNDLFFDDKRFSYNPKFAFNGKKDAEFEKHMVKTVSLYGSTYVEDDNFCVMENEQLQCENAVNQIKNMLSGKMICYAGRDNSLVIGSDGLLYKCTISLYDSTSCVGKIDYSNGEFKYNQNYTMWTYPFSSVDKLEKCSNCAIFPACLGIGCVDKTQKENYFALWCVPIWNEVQKLIEAVSYINNDIYNLERFL